MWYHSWGQVSHPDALEVYARLGARRTPTTMIAEGGDAPLRALLKPSARRSSTRRPIRSCGHLLLNRGWLGWNSHGLVESSSLCLVLTRLLSFDDALKCFLWDAPATFDFQVSKYERPGSHK